MEASARLLAASSSPSALARRLLLPRRHFPFFPSPNPRSSSRSKLLSCPSRNCAARAFLSFPSGHNAGRPFLSLSSPPRSISSDLRRDLTTHPDVDTNNGSLLSDRARNDLAGSDLGFCGGRAGPWTVVLLGWLGAEEKHLRRYAEMYAARGIMPVRFVVPVRDTLKPDLCRSVEEKIDELAEEIASWCQESKERNLIFHTFSNTGWLVYGVLLQNFQSRNGVIEKIRGCVIDSAPSAEISPKVWAAGYYAALVKKRNATLVEPVEGGSLDGRNGKLNVQDIISSCTEFIILKLLEVFFSLALMLPYANQRLSSVISTLKDQPPYPQLYLYSSADKVIPANVVECFIKEQKALGRTVYAYDFGSSPHVDHFRSFPHVYSAKVNEFLECCCSEVLPKR